MGMFKMRNNTPELSDKFSIWVSGTISMWRQDFNGNVRIESGLHDLLGNDKISLETSVGDADLNTVQGWCTTGKSILHQEAETGKEAWTWVILFLKCLEKELQSELVESWKGIEAEAFLWRVLLIQFQS